MDPTEEQAQAIELFRKGDSLAIEAGAGTGKTSTLVMIAKAAPGERGQYVAFNKALVEESKAKFPEWVQCNTAHSLAFRAVGKHYAPRLNSSQRMTGTQIAARLGIGHLEVLDFQEKPKHLFPGFLAGLAAKTVTRFCQSADPEITAKHVPFIEGLSPDSAAAVRAALIQPAREMWTDLQKKPGEGGWASFKHEHYLKMWQLSSPRIYGDYILFDEAQDANPVIADVIAQQAEHGTQTIYVGDSQQEIYAWTGAVNALAKIEGVERTFLTQSFRFGQVIADRANEVLTTLDAALRLTGNPAIDSRRESIDSPKAILVRTNATGLTTLMKMQEAGKSVHFLGGTDELVRFAEGAEELMGMGHTNHPDLVCFDSWQAVRDYVQMDEGGEDLRLMVRLMDNFGTAEIKKAIFQMPAESRADVVISTSHKSKGREWDSVQLAGDFPQQGDSDPADLRLLYVSLTRAKLVLDDTIFAENNAEVIV